MKTKKTIAIVAAILAGTAFTSAQELSVSASVAYESEYIFRGVHLADSYIAPSVDLSYGDMYVGIWGAMPFKSDFDNEIDVYAGYGFDISEVVSADIGFTYYTYPSLADGVFDSDVNTFEVYTGLSFEAPLSPSVYAFYDFDLEAWTLETSAGHTIEVSESTSLELAGYLGYVKPDGGSSYVYYGAGVSYSIALAENASWSIGVNWYGADEEIVDGDKSRFTIGTSFSAGF